MFTLTGPELYSKYIWRCRSCRLVPKDDYDKSMQQFRQDVWYHPDMYGNNQTGWAFYKNKDFEFVKCNNQVFFTKELVEHYISLLHHAWVSQEGQSEAYNESHRNSNKVELFKDLMTNNKNVGVHFNQRGEGEVSDDLDIPDNDLYNEGQKSNLMHEMHRKNLSQAVYRHWIYEELKERKLLGKILFGPRLGRNDVYISYKDSVEHFLLKVDGWRTGEVYDHEDCTGECSDHIFVSFYMHTNCIF